MNKKCLAILFVMTLALILAFGPGVRANPIDISFEPTSGTVGTLVSVSGSADTENGFVDIYWDLPGNVLLTVQAEGTYYEAEIQIPEAVAGTHAIGAKDVQAATTYAENFIVISDFTLTPNVGRIGLTVAISGTGFASSSDVTVTWDDPALDVLTTTSNAKGTFGGSFVVPSSLAGDHTVTATDEDENTDSDTFAVLPITISINPSSGPVGTEVTITGSYATPGGSVSILWDDVEDGSTTADGVGDYSYLLTVPPALAEEHTITAVDVMSTNNAFGTFTLLPITISIDPISGPVGTTVAVTGTYATPEGSVEIQWDGVVVDTVLALLDGTYSYELTIPPATNGDHTITAVDVASTNTASETFTVIALITLDPEDGLVDDVVLVTGTGFSGVSLVDVYFDMDLDGVPELEELVLDDVPTDAYGSFDSTFNVPWVPTAGNYLVIAIDAEGVTDDATFTVLFVMYTRSDEYFQGDYPSFFIQAVNKDGDPLGWCQITVQVFDPDGYLQYKGWTLTIPDDGTVPYDMQFFSWMVDEIFGEGQLVPLHLPSDAPVGTWKWEAFTCQELTVSGSFEVVEAVDLRTLLEKLDQLLEGQDNIAGLIAYYGEKLQLEHEQLALLIIEVADKLQLEHEELANLIAEVAGDLSMEHEELAGLIASVAAKLQMEHEALAGLIAGISEQMTLEHGELATLIGEVFDALEIKLDDIKTEIIGIEENVDGLYLVIGDLEVKLDDVQAKLVDIQDDLIRIETAIGDLELTVGEGVLIYLEAIEAKLDTIGTGVVRIESAIGDVELKLDETVIPFLNAIEAKLHFINATTLRIESAIGDIEVKLEDIGDFLDDIKAEIVDIDEKIATIETDIGTIKVDLTDINTQITVANENIATIETDIGTIEGRLTSVEGDVATIETDIGTIKTTTDSIQTTGESIKDDTSLQPATVALSLIAALAAIAAAVMVLRKVYVK